jgi:hypothetical protein
MAAATKLTIKMKFYKSAADEVPQHSLDIKPIHSENGRLEKYEITYKEKNTLVVLNADSLEQYISLFALSIPHTLTSSGVKPEHVQIDVPGFPTMSLKGVRAGDNEAFHAHIVLVMKLLAAQTKWPTALLS